MVGIPNVLCLAIITVALAAVNVDYCKLPCNSAVHTMCKFTSAKPAALCKQAHDIGLSNAEKTCVIKKHNDLRRKVATGKERRGKPGPQPAAIQMPDLTWDDELETIAQRWANQCIFAHDECRRVERYAVGQNVAISAAVGQEPQGLEGMIQSWYDEVALFDKKLVSAYEFSSQTAHYTQIVWGNTLKIGCGRIKYKNENDWDTILFVCNYGPSGNWLRQKMYETKTKKKKKKK